MASERVVLPTRVAESMAATATPMTTRMRALGWSKVLQEPMRSGSLAKYMLEDADQNYMLPIYRTRFSNNEEGFGAVLLGVADAASVARDFYINNKGQINTDGVQGLYVVLFPSGFATGIDLDQEETTVLQSLMQHKILEYPGFVDMEKLEVFRGNIPEKAKDRIRDNIRRIHVNFLTKVANLSFRSPNTNILYEFVTAAGQPGIDEMIAAVKDGNLYIPVPDETNIISHHTSLQRNFSL